jgi:branched-chain amino acid transport system substrate-binding protein
MYLVRVKTPEESTGPWDYYEVLRTIPGDEAFLPIDQSACPLVGN